MAVANSRLSPSLTSSSLLQCGGGMERREDDTRIVWLGFKRGTNFFSYVIKLEMTPAFTRVWARQRPVKMARERRSSSENAFRKRRILRISSSRAF